MRIAVADYLIRLVGRQNATDLSSPLDGETKLDPEPPETNEIVEAYRELDARVERRHNDITSGSNASKATTTVTRSLWLGRETATARARKLEQKGHLNDRAIEVLAGRLGNHLAIRDHITAEIERIMRSPIYNDPPATVLEFASALHRAGLGTTAMSNVSQQRVEGLAKFLADPNGTDGHTALISLVPGLASSIIGAAEEIGEARGKLSNLDRADDDWRALISRVPRWSITHGAAPRDYWSFVEDFGHGLTAVTTHAPDAAEKIEKMPLPPADNWTECREIDKLFSNYTKSGIASYGAAEHYLNGYFNSVLRTEQSEIPKEWKKIWILFLSARHEEINRFRLIYPEAYFEGLCLPDIGAANGMVRQIVRMA